MSEHQSTVAPAGVSEPDGGTSVASLEKVRDLLFGVQMRDYDRKFARLEERLIQETSDLREEVKKRLATIDQFIRKEVESLSDRLQAEQQERSRGSQDLSRELKETTQTFEKKTTQLDELIARTQRELRQQLHDHHQELGDDIRQRADEVLGKLARESRELRSDKTDRSALASLFTEMAMRLNGEFRIPAPEEAGRG